MLHINFTASVSAALFGYSRLITKIHELSSEALPVSWVRSIEEMPYYKEFGNPGNEIRMFGIITHLGNNPRALVRTNIRVERIFRIDEVERWIPLSATLFSFRGKKDWDLVYTCRYMRATGELTLSLQHPYPYMHIKA